MWRSINLLRLGFVWAVGSVIYCSIKQLCPETTGARAWECGVVPTGVVAGKANTACINEKYVCPEKGVENRKRECHLEKAHLQGTNQDN